MALQYLMNLDEQFKATIEAAHHRVSFSEPKHPLYHFTDEAGLRGILRTRSLWASLSTAMEDTSEIEYALERAKRILYRRENGGDSSIFDEIAAMLDHDRFRSIDPPGIKTYTISLRSNVDVTSHWQKYGRAGKGFALALAPRHLVTPGIRLMPVLYDPGAQDKFIHDFIESNMKLFYNHLPTCPWEHLSELQERAVQFTAIGLWSLAPVLKDPKYSNEKEWRLIVVDPEQAQVRDGMWLSKDVRVRRSSNRYIPYKILRYEVLPIVGLDLGPSAIFSESDESLKQLLKNAASGSDVPVTRSQVPASSGEIRRFFRPEGMKDNESEDSTRKWNSA